MGKIKIQSVLTNSNTKEIDNVICYGIKIGNKIIYKDNNIKVIIKCLDNKLEIVRDNIEYMIFLKLEKNKTTDSTYNIKNLGTLNITTKTNFLSINKNEIKAIYEIINLDNNEQFEFTLKYEVI